MSRLKIKSLTYLLRNHSPYFNHDNLHRIAISNLDNGRRRQERWFSKKYQKPLKEYEDHHEEELWIEMLEDFYDAHPVEIHRFMEAESARTNDGWDGRMSSEYEKQIKQKLQRINERNGVDISKYQSGEKLTQAQEEKILADLGMNLPKSRKVIHGSPIRGEKPHEVHTLGEEFDEDFGEP